MGKVNLFLQRWSRLKTQAEEASVAPESPANAATKPAELPPSELPSLDSLTPDSDFSAFLRPEVDAETRQAALKKLFMTDHYRTMDMIDVYVDDYSKPELLPADMLAKLDHAVALLAKPEQVKPEPAKPARAAEDNIRPTDHPALNAGGEGENIIAELPDNEAVNKP